MPSACPTSPSAGRLIALFLGSGTPEDIPRPALDWLLSARRWAVCASPTHADDSATEVPEPPPAPLALVQTVGLAVPHDLLHLTPPEHDDSATAWQEALTPLHAVLAGGEDVVLLLLDDAASATCLSRLAPHLNASLVAVPAQTAAAPFITDIIHVPPNLA